MTDEQADYGADLRFLESMLAQFDPAHLHAWGLEICEREFLASKNPLYAWQAIRYCAEEARRCALESGASQDEALAAPPMPLPQWVLRYLATVADQFYPLSLRLDVQICPSEDDDGFEEAYARWRNNPTLDAGTALGRVTRILGFPPNGRSAFRNLSGKWDRLKDLHTFDKLREQGHTATAARKIMLEGRTITDERSLQRRIARARQEWDHIYPKAKSDHGST
jgi:hypothetical protein